MLSHFGSPTTIVARTLLAALHESAGTIWQISERTGIDFEPGSPEEAELRGLLNEMVASGHLTKTTCGPTFHLGGHTRAMMDRAAAWSTSELPMPVPARILPPPAPVTIIRQSGARCAA